MLERQLKRIRLDKETLAGSQLKVDIHAVLTTGVHGVGAGTVAKTSDITSTKLDDLTTPDDNTDLNANTTNHGLVVKATAPAANILNVVAIANGETAYTNKAIFDATNPEAWSVAAPGTSLIAAHRDHVHLDPVTAHVAAGDPHTGYRLEAADHSHESTGAQAGQLDHGLALTGLTDDDHTQYLLKQMAENDPILLDAALSADGKYSGICEAGTAGAVLAFGDLVYLAVADSRWELCDASAEATAFGKIGICVLAAAGDGSATTILLFGKVRVAAFPTLTIGAPVYMSETAGDITSTAPTTSGAIVRIIGYGNTAAELYFTLDNTYVELA